MQSTAIKRDQKQPIEATSNQNAFNRNQPAMKSYEQQSKQSKAAKRRWKVIRSIYGILRRFSCALEPNQVKHPKNPKGPKQ